MRARAVVVVDVARQDALEMALTQSDHVIQTLPPYGADQPFGIRILPRSSRRGRDFFDPERGGLPTKCLSVDGISIA